VPGRQIDLFRPKRARCARFNESLWQQSGQHGETLLTTTWLTFFMDERFRETLRMYWPHLVATALFGMAIAQYVAIGRWEALLRPIAVAALGYGCAVASYEVADWTGQYGWSYESFWTYPPAWVRAAGFVILVAVNLVGFRR
jgi:hypothetical protein